MSRFFRSALFPILIVILLAIGAQRLLSPSTETKKYQFSDFLTQLSNGEVKEAVLKTRNNTVNVTLRDKATYEIGYPNDYGDSLITRLQSKHVPFNVEGNKGSLWGPLLSFLLPALLFIGFWLFLMNQVQGGGAKVMSFGKSRAKRMSVDSPKISFSDVAGVDEAVEELGEIKEFLENPKKFQALGARIPKGVLLYGPPGTGKTLLARAVAGEAGVPFFSISGSDFVEMFVGVGASVTGDTPVLVRDAQSGTRLVPIAEVVDSYYEDDSEGFVVQTEGVETLGYESRESGFRGRLDGFGNSAWQSVEGVYRHRVDEIFEVRYLGGALRMTGDHSVFVRGHGGISSKAACDLKPGDVLVDLPFKVRRGFDRERGTQHELRAHNFDEVEPLTLDLVERDDATLAAYEYAVANAGVISQAAIASEVGVSQATVGNWQSGQHEPRAISTKMHGIKCGIRHGQQSGGRIINSTPLPDGEYWNLIIGKTSNPFLPDPSTHQHKKPIVQSVTRSPFSGFVYDLCGCGNEAFFGGEKPVLLHNSRVRDLFEQAKQNSPCIIFMDEIDAVGRHRGAGLGGGHDEREQTLNQLLVEMDGFEMKDNIILIAATNRPDILDPALLRPGRFDRQIVVDRPDRKGREQILAVHTRGKPLAADIDVDVLAGQTPGFTGADLANLINEAALLAARNDKREITQLELEEGIMRVIAGPEKKTRVMSEQERRITAFHEMGHAFVGHFLEHADPVHKISIISRGQALGYTISLPQEDKFLTTRAELLDSMAMTLGGRAAEELVFSEITTGASNDLEKVTQTAKQMVMRYGMSEKLGPRVFGHEHSQPFLGREFSSEPDYSDEIAREIDDEIRRIVESAHRQARSILTEHREQLGTISEILFRHETIEKEQFEALLAGKSEEEVFPPEKPEPVPPVPPPPPAPAGEREKPRPLPRPGFATDA